MGKILTERGVQQGRLCFGARWCSAHGCTTSLVVCHESDLTPGLANKLCKPFARRFATTFPERAAGVGRKG